MVKRLLATLLLAITLAVPARAQYYYYPGEYYAGWFWYSWWGPLAVLWGPDTCTYVYWQNPDYTGGFIVACGGSERVHYTWSQQ